MLHVYYEEINGDLQPHRVLVKPQIEYSVSRHSIQSPFERFYEEDFHDELKVLTISQATLTRDSFHEYIFNINIDQVKSELRATGLDPNHVYDADYLLILMADLEEVLQMTLKKQFRIEV